MNCPRCGTSNLDTAAKCVRCEAVLVPVGDAETFIGVSLPPVPGNVKPATAAAPAPAIAAVTPPPDASNAQTIAGWAAIGAAPSTDQVDFGPRYRIDRMLGQGGMGSVYKAWDKELQRPVALKLIRPGLALDPAVEARFKQELLLASKISHKNVLRIHDLGEAAGVKFISMAYVEGQDLHGLLTHEGKLTIERTVKLARQMCSALDAAHSEGVVHRDFKPQNILLDKQENVYVSDFGLAKSLESDTGMTKSGEFLGTPRYMAPEQVQGGGVDHRADLYALGLILYEMVTGDVPFHADTTLQLMYKRVHEVPKSPKVVNPELPEWIVRVIMKCIERDPAQRYQSASEIMHDLDTAKAPAKVGSRTVQIALPGVEVSRKWLVAIAAVVVLITALFAVPSLRHRIFGDSTAATAPVVETKHVAVLPLKIIGDEKALGYIADGVVDALTAKLFQMKDVQIAAPSAVAKLKPDTSPTDAANALGAKLIVTGNLQGEGDKVRLVLNLDDADGKRMWTQEFSGLKQDLLTLEDNAYSKLVSAMSVKTTSEEIARTGAHPTENVDAYDLYLKGRNAMRGEVDAKTVNAAIKFYAKPCSVTRLSHSLTQASPMQVCACLLTPKMPYGRRRHSEPPSRRRQPARTFPKFILLWAASSRHRASRLKRSRNSRVRCNSLRIRMKDIAGSEMPTARPARKMTQCRHIGRQSRSILIIGTTTTRWAALTCGLDVTKRHSPRIAGSLNLHRRMDLGT